MKKLITLTFALFFTAGVAFAQENTAETRQSGSDAEVTVTQSGMSNFAGTRQTGDGSEIIVRQAGDNNLIERGQRTGVIDDGDQNYARVRQVGSQNKAEVRFNGSSLRNEVFVDQGVDGTSSRTSDMTAIVDGVNNAIDLDQRGTIHRAEFHVAGGEASRNEVRVFQSGFRNKVDRAEAEEDRLKRGVFISGSDNVVDIVQTGDENTAWTQIGGDFSTVDIMQTGNGHSASATVTGMNNTSTITQSN